MHGSVATLADRHVELPRLQMVEHAYGPQRAPAFVLLGAYVNTTKPEPRQIR
jgi:hypothetical protein